MDQGNGGKNAEKAFRRYAGGIPLYISHYIFPLSTMSYPLLCVPKCLGSRDPISPQTLVAPCMVP